MSCLFGEVCREDDIILDEHVAIRGWALETWHALAFDGLHETGLRDALAHQRDDVPVQVGQVTLEAKQGLVDTHKKIIIIPTGSRKGRSTKEHKSQFLYLGF